MVLLVTAFLTLLAFLSLFDGGLMRQLWRLVLFDELDFLALLSKFGHQLFNAFLFLLVADVHLDSVVGVQALKAAHVEVTLGHLTVVHGL